MNIIRTKAVELSVIPAIAYKQKLSDGGAGVKIFRLDCPAKGVFTIDRRTGAGVAYGAVDETMFSKKAVDEAIELTTGLPYSGRGKLEVTYCEEKEQHDVAPNEPGRPDMTSSDEYWAILKEYCGNNDKLDYARMNKDFIQFANKSKVVIKMAEDRASLDDILTFIIKSRATVLSGKKDSLSDEDTNALIDTLDEINPRSAFKELKDHIKKMLAKRK